MYNILTLKPYPLGPYRREEILRYAGVKAPAPAVERLLNECLSECEGCFEAGICAIRLPVQIKGDTISFDLFSVNSKNLAKNLSGCEEAVLFAATVGLGIDRLILKHSHTSAAKSAMFQAIGAERIESVCDAFNAALCEEEKKRGAFTRPRFSPGYGDLPLGVQREIFAALDCHRKIGLTLNEGMLMSPSKSVTAFIGISKQSGAHGENACARCGMQNCSMRRTSE